jgi:hypothetical protein
MPTEEFGAIEQSSMLIEVRGIRAGELGGNAPIKTKPKVRYTVKAPKAKVFEVDTGVMKAAAKRLGVEEVNVDAIPVFLTTDKVVGDDGVVYVERAFYTGRGRLCGSAGGTNVAEQKADVVAYSKNKAIKMYGETKRVDCNKQCPLWTKPGIKSDCGWRMIVTVGLTDMPVFPSTVRYRSKSWYGISATIGSLNAISRVTGGVLQGIPLWLKQITMETKNEKGEWRRFPVMFFEFRGTPQELRDHAVRELASRTALANASAGKFADLPKVFGTTRTAPIIDMEDTSGDESSSSTVVEDDADGDEIDEGEFVEDTRVHDAVGEAVALAAKKAGVTGPRLRALEEKHDGDLEKVLAELKAMDTREDWSPGSPGSEIDVAEDPGFDEPEVRKTGSTGDLEADDLGEFFLEEP